MNKVILIGNLATNPEPFETESGIARSTFRLAVQRKYANQQGVREADFLTVVAWRQTADFCNSYLVKGRKVAIEGAIQIRSYDGQDGQKRWVTEIIADSVEALGSPKGASADPGPEEPPARPRQEEPPARPRQEEMELHRGGDDFTEIEDDELPF